MMVRIPAVLSAGQLASARRELDQGDWIDGRETAGHQSARVKENRQLPEAHATTRRLGAMILDALDGQPLFMSAALPLKVLPPLFNRYEGGQHYGSHIDGAIRQIPGTPHRVRTDLSATLFLSPPEDYDGGELTIEDTYGTHRVKLPAGDMVLYPGSSRHRVEPVTRGARLAAFFWIQSMVRDDGERALLYQLDTAIQGLDPGPGGPPEVLVLTSIYHNLLRRWADA